MLYIILCIWSLDLRDQKNLINTLTSPGITKFYAIIFCLFILHNTLLIMGKL